MNAFISTKGPPLAYSSLWWDVFSRVFIIVNSSGLVLPAQVKWFFSPIHWFIKQIFIEYLLHARIDLTHKRTHRAVPSNKLCPGCRAWKSGGRNKERVLLGLDDKIHRIPPPRDKGKTRGQTLGRKMENFLPLVWYGQGFPVNFRDIGGWKGRLMSVDFWDLF